jgi:phosphatidylserine decarboxylase
MMITRYGLDTALPVIIVSLLIAAGGFFFSSPALKTSAIVTGMACCLFTLYFFRDPDRNTPDIPGAVFAPADGKVILVKETDEPEFIGGKAMLVAIFMSPLNVHVNRFPISGRIGYFRHIPGRYLVAFEDKASDANERTLIGIDNGSGRVLFKQIAGLVARRIVCPLKPGDSAVAGRRFGMIKFGSRVDVLLPATASVSVTIGQTVTAGETVLARLADPAAGGEAR